MQVDLARLHEWDDKILELVGAYGLHCREQEFEICDHKEMLAYMSYSGMPSHYPHWSYGKAYEKLKTLYGYGVQGLPYEMVINSDPSLAYLMRDNSLCLNVLTIAHVYGHNDFFNSNFHFRSTRPEFTIPTFKSHADRIRSYVEDPSVGTEKVEPLLDAAHALSLQCRRNLAVRKLSPVEQQRRAFEASLPRKDAYRTIHVPQEYVEPDLHKVPLEPEEDLLLFLRDTNPYLAEWEKDILTIVHEEACYFLPQVETKIMNEGWASYWHHQIMTHLDLPEELRIEFMIRHNAVLQPVPGGLNPYHLGFTIWTSIYREHEGDEPAEHGKPSAGKDALFQVRASERDTSFIRRFLTDDLMRELGLFEYGPRKGKFVVTDVADDDGCETIKETLIRNVGMGVVPVIKVEDADYGGSRSLLLAHDFDGRELEPEATEKTLAHIYRLWGRTVVLATVVSGKQTLLSFNQDGLSKLSSSPG